MNNNIYFMLPLFLYRFLFPLRFLFPFRILVSGFPKCPIKAAFATRINLVTQVTEAANFSCWSRKSKIGLEAHKKFFSLQYVLRKVPVNGNGL